MTMLFRHCASFLINVIILMIIQHGYLLATFLTSSVVVFSRYLLVHLQ